MVFYRSQKNGTGALMFSGEGKCSSVFRRREKVLYCLQEKGPGAILFSGEGNMFSTDIRRRKLVL